MMTPLRLSFLKSTCDLWEDTKTRKCLIFISSHFKQNLQAHCLNHKHNLEPTWCLGRSHVAQIWGLPHETDWNLVSCAGCSAHAPRLPWTPQDWSSYGLIPPSPKEIWRKPPGRVITNSRPLKAEIGLHHILHKTVKSVTSSSCWMK